MTHQPRASFKSPRFAQPATFMRLPHVEDPRGLDVAIGGVPYDGGTSYRPGARLGPREIRSQSSLIRSYSYFQKVAPFDRLNVADVGDVDAPPVSIEKCYDAVEARIGAIADAGARPLVIGGDHSISLPVLRALAKRYGPLGLVQVDAHIDTWDEYFGGKYFHGTPFRRVIEERLIDGRRFIQVGIRGPMYGEEDFEFHAEAAPSHLGWAGAAPPPPQAAPTGPSGWAPEAEKELGKIPFFVRGKARRNTERYAAQQGIALISIETLYDAKAHFSR